MVYVVAVQGKDAADAASRVRNNLGRAGLVVNTKESNWVPTQCLVEFKYLKLDKGKVKNAERKLGTLQEVILSKALPARSCAGHCIAILVIL